MPKAEAMVKPVNAVAARNAACSIGARQCAWLDEYGGWIAGMAAILLFTCAVATI